MNAQEVNALPVFDEEGIASMRSMLGDEFDSIVDEFIQTTPPLIDSLKAAVDGGETDEILSIAHRLKSGSGNLGMKAFYTICEYLEHSMRDGKDIAFADVLGIIDEQFTRISNH